jgi:hypothetical protein
MGCAQSRRGVFCREGQIESVIYDGGDGTTGDFEAEKISGLAVDDHIYTCFRDDNNDPPFSPSGMGNGDEVNTLDGGPEVFGGGNDRWFTLEINNGSAEIAVPENQLLPAVTSMGLWSDVLAKDLTTSLSLATVYVPMGMALSTYQITDITQSTDSGQLYHPLFDTPLNSHYYAAANGSAWNYGILVATCQGEF